MVSAPTRAGRSLFELAFAIPESSWNGRTLDEGCAALEQLSQGEPLAFEAAFREEATGSRWHRHRIEERASFLEQVVARSSGVRLESSESQDSLAMVFSTGFHARAHGIRTSRLALACVPTTEQSLPGILAAVGDALRAVRCHFVPPAINATVERALQRLTMRDEPDFGLVQRMTNLLPAIVAHGADDRPRRVGWLTYWSAATCAFMGFPDPEKDAPVLARSFLTAQRAWLIKLTDEPLDLEREDHRAALAWAYKRFDRLSPR